MNFGSAKNKAIKYISEWSNKGALISAAKNADYTLQFPDSAQSAQTEIATIKKIHAVYNFSQNPIKPLAGLMTGFDEVQFLGTDYTNMTGQGAKAYYFEMDKPGTVYIEEETASNVWTLLDTLSITGITYFTPYKGFITPSLSTNSVRLRFSGTYPYNIRYRALWAYSFATVNDIPDYRPFVKYPLPPNAMEIKKVINETETRQYKALSDYYIEGKTTLVVNYFFTGSFRVEFYQYPTEITSATDDDFEFELDYEAQELIPYYMAASVMLADKETRPFGVLRLNEYQAKLANLSTEQNESFAILSDVTGW